MATKPVKKRAVKKSASTTKKKASTKTNKDPAKELIMKMIKQYNDDIGIEPECPSFKKILKEIEKLGINIDEVLPTKRSYINMSIDMTFDHSSVIDPSGGEIYNETFNKNDFFIINPKYKNLCDKYFKNIAIDINYHDMDVNI